MKTLVVVDLPGGLVTLMLCDLALAPTRGSFYLFEDKRYEVIETLEFLGFRNRNGIQLSGAQKLMAVLSSVYGDAVKAMTAMTKRKDIGHSDEPEQTTHGGIILPGNTAGGIALPENQFAGDFDHVLFLRTKPVTGTLPSVRLNAVAALGDGAQSLTSEDEAAPPAEESDSPDQ